MNETNLHQLLADLVLSLHVAIVLFVAGGLILILAGNWRGWRWVNTWWLRLTHLAAITIVMAEAWLGFVCPLTTLEMRLREKANAATYEGSFVEHWLQRVLYYDAPPWAFTLLYTLFGLAVAPPGGSCRHIPPGSLELRELLRPTRSKRSDSCWERGRHSPAAKRELGQDRGLFEVPDDFDAPLPEEIQRSFEG